MKNSFSPIKYSFLGLLLLGASVITSAFLSKSESKKTFNGNLHQSNTPQASGQKTCKVLVSGTPACTWTATNANPKPDLSSTSSIGQFTSDLTLPGDIKTVTDTFNDLHSSQSPV